MTKLAADAEQLKQRVEDAWREGEHTVTSMWHQSAIAALHWVSAHRSRVSGFRQAVKNTPIEKAIDVALKTLRSEAHSPAAPPTRKTASRKATPRRASGSVTRLAGHSATKKRTPRK